MSAVEQVYAAMLECAGASLDGLCDLSAADLRAMTTIKSDRTVTAARAQLAAEGSVEVVEAAPGKRPSYRVNPRNPTPAIDPRNTPAIAGVPTPAIDPRNCSSATRAYALDTTVAVEGRGGVGTGVVRATTPAIAETAGVAEVGPTVVGWAVDEQRRRGKPVLDGAMLKRIGSTAKRMAEAGVPPVELKAAAEYLVGRDMTDLQAAHRRCLADAAPVSGDLQARAAASRAARDPMHLGRLREGELVEASAKVARVWRNAVIDEAEWAHGLRDIPIGGVLWGIDQYARTGAAWPPTWGQVWALADPEARRLRRVSANREARRREDERLAAS